MNLYLTLPGNLALGGFALAGLSALLATLLIVAALSHPFLAWLAIMLVAGALTQR